MHNYYLDYSFKDYTKSDREEKIKEFIADFCYNTDFLDKRINKLFSMNKWLYSYYDKEDVKQEVIVSLLNKSLNKFPYIVGEDRVRYFNTVVSSVLCNLFKDKFDKNGTLILDDKMELDCNLMYHDDDSMQEIFDLFVNEQMERQLVELYYQGYSNKEIMQILDVGRSKFESIRENVRKRLRKEGYANEN